MKNRIISIFCVLIFCHILFCEDQSDLIEYDINALDIGLDISNIKFKEDKYRRIVIDSTFSFPYFRILSDNVVYDICYDWNMKVRYIAVESGDFVTPEGIYLNMLYGDFVKIIGKVKLKKERLVGYYVKLSSGWYISFWVGNTGIDYPPQKTDTVYAIFKKDSVN
ncbi:hypothetical protein [Treponema pedis]|uniref:Uncharacterized protein n=1 Tax=Treponema pedis TaxID=409322 RepID=A0A7S6WRJ3_9SPIR|nr:hypothetical protein [Treponema pedis]QOW61917.1 hypothetical protein IFE08_06105 [Treponema pedis]